MVLYHAYKFPVRENMSVVDSPFSVYGFDNFISIIFDTAFIFIGLREGG